MTYRQNMLVGLLAGLLSVVALTLMLMTATAPAPAVPPQPTPTPYER